MNQELELLMNIALAVIIGGLVGLDRELQGKPAGLRTHMLVAGASALFAGLGTGLIGHFADDTQLIRADPIRITEAILTGISFLGAGTIIRMRGEPEVEGLTTAASQLFVAGLGIAVAINSYVLAAGGTILVVIVLRVLKWLEQHLHQTVN
ncbi:MAG: MgtC/SapB family protein [Candidatus Promineifilaceae bacterium]|nr:MgtC/SapB family protein [Candidatus Promineifilaceae bacterium]